MKCRRNIKDGEIGSRSARLAKASVFAFLPEMLTHPCKPLLQAHGQGEALAIKVLRMSLYERYYGTLWGDMEVLSTRLSVLCRKSKRQELCQLRNHATSIKVW